MADRIPVEKKSKPGINFLVSIPFNLPISAPMSLQNKFKEAVERKGTNISYLLRKWFFELFNSRNPQELLSKNRIIREKINELRKELKDESGLSSKEFQTYIREKMEEYIKENDENAVG